MDTKYLSRRCSAAITNNRGLTLVEIVVVIVLIAIIGSVVIKGVTQTGEGQKAKLNQLRMQSLKQKVSNYRMEYNTYPSALDDLVKPSSKLSGSGKLFIPLAEEEELQDIWGAPYIYKPENNNRSYSLTSLGADGAAGGEGPDQDLTMRP